jgi:putative membrane protein
MILRRSILAALAALAATASFAQSQAGLAPSAAGPDQEYVRQTLAASSAALAISRLAAQKAQNDDLREFAYLEAAEQETLVDVLKSHAAGRNRGGLQPGDAEVEQHLDQRGRDTLESLRAQTAGPDFDHAYMGALATGHLELLGIQETYLDSGQNDVNLANVAKLTRRTVKEHLQLLADIESGLETAATTGVTPGSR